VSVVGKFLYFWLSGIVFALLLGCTPEFNWRELSVADDRVVLAFPAKVQTEQRQLQIDDLKLVFSLSAANVGPAVFAVGYAPLPQGLGATQEMSLKRALLGSLFGPSGKEITQAALEGKAFELETVVAKQPSVLVARVFVHRGMLIQVVASGPEKSLPREQAQEFIRSLVLK
jgi:hypothetical protein